MTNILVSFPKSGRTWVRHACQLAGLAVKFTHAGHGGSKKEIGRRFTEIPENLKDLPLAFLYRNPLDTSVSFFFHLQYNLDQDLGHLPKIRWARRLKIAERRLRLHFQNRMPPKTLEEFVLDDRFGVDAVSAFNRGWLDYLSERDDCLVISYEELKADQVAGFSRLFTFFGKPDVDVEHIVEQSSFENMRKKELKGADPASRLRREKPDNPESGKVRRGKVKGYVDYLDEATIQQARQIAARHGFEI